MKFDVDLKIGLFYLASSHYKLKAKGKLKLTAKWKGIKYSPRIQCKTLLLLMKINS